MWIGFVLQRQAVQFQRLAHYVDAQRRRWIASASVMVAADQQQPQMGLMFPPAFEGVQGQGRAGFRGVQEVTEKDDLAAVITR